MAWVFASSLFWPFLEFLTLETNTTPFATAKRHLFYCMPQRRLQFYFGRHERRSIHQLLLTQFSPFTTPDSSLTVSLTSVHAPQPFLLTCLALTKSQQREHFSSSWNSVQVVAWWHRSSVSCLRERESAVRGLMKHSCKLPSSPALTQPLSLTFKIHQGEASDLCFYHIKNPTAALPPPLWCAGAEPSKSELGV